MHNTTEKANPIKANWTTETNPWKGQNHKNYIMHYFVKILFHAVEVIRTECFGMRDLCDTKDPSCADPEFFFGGGCPKDIEVCQGDRHIFGYFTSKWKAEHRS